MAVDYLVRTMLDGMVHEPVRVIGCRWIPKVVTTDPSSKALAILESNPSNASIAAKSSAAMAMATITQAIRKRGIFTATS